LASASILGYRANAFNECRFVLAAGEILSMANQSTWFLKRGKSKMPRGGARPGAGRKRNVPLVPPGGTPLDYMLAVMRDERATPARRDKMALAAAPFVHQRMSPTIPDGDDQPTGKKAVEARAAKNPDTSTTMGALLAKRGGRS
jgi:hypothetical protein